MTPQRSMIKLWGYSVLSPIGISISWCHHLSAILMTEAVLATFGTQFNPTENSDALCEGPLSLERHGCTAASGPSLLGRRRQLCQGMLAGGLEHGYEGKVAVLLLVVEAVPDNKGVGDFEAAIRDGVVYNPPDRAVEERAHLQAGRAPLP